jgi:hypothetical protein
MNAKEPPSCGPGKMILDCFEELCVFTEARERSCMKRERQGSLSLVSVCAREKEGPGGGWVYDNQQVTEGR